MEMQFEHLFDKLTEFIQSEAKTETIIGDSFELGEFKCVPVVKMGMGFGSGAGEGDGQKKEHGEGGAVGGGIGIAPIGFLVSKDDNISFISTEKKGGLSAAFEKVPDLIEKYMDKKEVVAN
jgi:uncharacterized spore protein YtfJ